MAFQMQGTVGGQIQSSSIPNGCNHSGMDHFQQQWQGARMGYCRSREKSGQPWFGPAIESRTAILAGASLGQVTVVGVEATIIAKSPSAIID
jgi:hypothetical protein